GAGVVRRDPDAFGSGSTVGAPVGAPFGGGMSMVMTDVASRYAIPRRIGSHRARAVTNAIMTGLCAAAVVVALVPLFSVLWLVVSKGVHSLSLSFFTQLPAPVGEVGGGVGNGIVGTLFMVGLASCIGLPLGVGAGIFLAERGD